jgi:hypothetical protein
MLGIAYFENLVEANDQEKCLFFLTSLTFFVVSWRSRISKVSRSFFEVLLLGGTTYKSPQIFVVEVLNLLPRSLSAIPVFSSLFGHFLVLFPTFTPFSS